MKSQLYRVARYLFLVVVLATLALVLGTGAADMQQADGIKTNSLSWLNTKRALAAPDEGSLFCVDNNGGNRYDGCANTTPYTTIQDAVNAASAGDTILILGGTYTDEVTIDKALVLVGYIFGYPDYTSPNIVAGNIAISAPVDVKNLTLDGITVSGAGVLTFVDGLTQINDTVTIENARQMDLYAQLNIDGTLTIRNFEWISGRQYGPGTTNIPADGTLIFPGGTDQLPVLSNHNLNNAGTATMSGYQFVSVEGTSVFNNLAGATFNMQGGNISGGGPSYGAFINAGTFIKSGAGLTRMTTVFTNTGTVDVQSGTMEFAYKGVNSAAINIGSGAEYRVTGAQTWVPGTTVSGTGLLSVMEGGMLVINTDLTLNNLTQNGDYYPYGTLSGTGTITVTHLSMIRGNQKGGGTTNIPAGGTLDIGAMIATYRTINNAGTTNFAPTGSLSLGSGATFNNQAGSTFDALAGGYSSMSLFDTGRFNNESGATFTVHSQLQMSGSDTYPGTFNNVGTFVKAAGADAINVGPIIFNNTGVVRADAGEIVFADNRAPSRYNGYEQQQGATILNGGTITYNEPAHFLGGSLSGNGIINGFVVNSGAVVSPGASPGRLILDNNYTHELSATLKIEIGGLTGSQYDHLIVDLIAYLGGTLEINFVDGFVPVAGNRFTIVSYALNNGEFSDIRVNGLPPGLTLQPQYGGSDMAVLVVPITTPTPLPTTTATATNTVVPPTVTATATSTTVVPCNPSFSDVHRGDYFYDGVRYLACSGAISGYSDGSFRPYNNTTRAQMTKIIVLATGLSLQTPARASFSDVPSDNPFYSYVETAAAHEIVGGYSDGNFRPYNNITRGQLTKVLVVAKGWTVVDPATPTFIDTPNDNPFYVFIETAYRRGLISGYADGSFKPGNGATRGQIAKIVYGAATQPIDAAAEK